MAKEHYIEFAAPTKEYAELVRYLLVNSQLGIVARVNAVEGVEKRYRLTLAHLHTNRALTTAQKLSAGGFVQGCCAVIFNTARS